MSKYNINIEDFNSCHPDEDCSYEHQDSQKCKFNITNGNDINQCIQKTREKYLGDDLKSMSSNKTIDKTKCNAKTLMKQINDSCSNMSYSTDNCYPNTLPSIYKVDNPDGQECSGCNNDTLSNILKEKYYYNNKYKLNYNNEQDISCYQMKSLNNICNSISSDTFNKQFNDFLKNPNYSPKKLHKDVKDDLIKSSFCQIAKDNISDIHDIQNDVSIIEWWYNNIFKQGFQKNIYYLIFFICIFLKIKILNLNQKPSNFYKYGLIIISLIVTFTFFILFLKKSYYVSFLYKYFIKFVAIIIVLGSAYSIKNMMNNTNIGKSNIILLIVSIIIIIIYTFLYLFNSNSLDNSNLMFESLIIGLLFLSLSILYFKTNNINLSSSTLMFLLLIIIGIYLFNFKYNYNITGFKMSLFYIIIFIIMLMNISYVSLTQTNNYNTAQKMQNKNMIVTYLSYFISIIGDSFLTVLSPQLSLSIMIIFRFIQGSWSEPLNGVLYSLINKYNNIKNPNKILNIFNN